MPDVLEAPAQSRQPPARLLPFCFDSERAKLAGLRSAEVKRQRKAPPINADGQPKDSCVANTINAQLALVEEMITRTRALLAGNACEHCKRSGPEPHHYAQLLKALDGWLFTQRKLLGIHDPGPSKAPVEREGKRRGQAEQLPAPMPTPSAPCSAAPAQQPSPSIPSPSPSTLPPAS